MKRTLFLFFGLCLMVSTNAFAEAEKKNSADEKEEVLVSENTEFIEIEGVRFVPEKKRDLDFFIGLEAPLFSYTKVKISNDDLDLNIESNEYKLNKDVLDNLSLIFGISTGNSGRVSFLISQNSTEIDEVDTDVSAYSLRFDVPFNTRSKVIPFIRFGLGYVSAEDDVDEFSAFVASLGFGGNYSISEKVFSYFALNYAFLLNADTGDSDLEYEEHGFSFSLGLGYKF